eukprot:1497623-Pleurochrysis_carterae.AAC.1
MPAALGEAGRRVDHPAALSEREQEECVRAARCFVHRGRGHALVRLSRAQERDDVGERVQLDVRGALQHKRCFVGPEGAGWRLAQRDGRAAEEVDQ